MGVSLERRILIDRWGRMLWMLRRMPWHAAYYLAGIALPPHERFWLGVYFGDTRENNIVASRGTSKSFTHASMAAPLKATLFKDVGILTFSASGFRGGKELFKDTDRMFNGQLKSQQLPGDYLKASTTRGRVISKDPSMWTVDLRSNSRHATVPTNNHEQLRGLRANEVLIDERNFFDDEIPHKIVRPMLVVGSDFRRVAKGNDRNRIFQISTIDYTIRGWYKELDVAKRDMLAQYEAQKARRTGDWDEYDRLMDENKGRLRTLSFSLSRFDYTDLIVPEVVPTIDGAARYRVNYPLEHGIQRDDILVEESDGTKAWYTYPVDRNGLEEPLVTGTVDPEIWSAEQRNIPISTSGNVFDHALIQKVSERAIPVVGAEQHAEGNEFYAPLMYDCGDPCVLGVDVARESDEVAFVVYRLGELSTAPFSPWEKRTDDQGRWVLGRTTWNHICWAESHRNMEATEVAVKIRDFYSRFNIIHVSPSGFDITEGIGGIAMDQKGGGSTVRDDLGNPKPPVVEGVPLAGWHWDDVLKIYDPDDDNGYGHYAATQSGPNFWGGLTLINAQNADNSEWTFGLRGLMQAGKCYIAYWMPPSQWAWEMGLVTQNGEPDRTHPEFLKWEMGYRGIRRLKAQLLRIQTKVSEQGVIRFLVPGDRTKEEGKKDFWAAGIYGYSLVRKHLNRAATPTEERTPMVHPLVINHSPSSLLPGLFDNTRSSFRF